MRKLGLSSLLLFLTLVALGLPTLAQLPDVPLVVPDSNFPDGPGKRGGEYVTSTTTDPTYLHPLYATGDSASNEVTGYAGVTAYPAPLNGFSGDPIALTVELAEMFEVDDLNNPTTITIKLRKGLRWSDGQPMTADDAEFTYAVNTHPDYVEVARSDSLLIGDQFPTFEKVDDLTFRYHLPGPVGIGSYLLGINLILLPKHVHEAAFESGELLSEDYWSPAFAVANPSAIVGAGPFRFTGGVIGQEYTFERNPYFWKADSNGTQLPYFDEVRLIVVENRDVELLKFINGEIMDLGPRPSDLPVIRQRAEQLGITVDIQDPAANGTANFITYNQDIGMVMQDGAAVSAGDPYKDSLRQLFREKNFRRAISKATDRQSVADNIFLGLASPIYGPSGFGPFDITGRPGSGGTLDPDYPLENFEFDPAAANALLDGLDLPLGADGLRVFGNSYPAAGQKVSIALRTNVENNIRVETMTLLAGDYTELLKLEHVPDPVPFNAAVSDLLAFPFSGGEAFPEFEAFHIGIGGGSVDPTNVLVEHTSGGFLHPYRFSDALATDASQLPEHQAKIDALFEQQAAIPSVSEAGDVGGLPGFLFGSPQERFDIVRQAQLAMADGQDIIYTNSQQALLAFYSNKLGNVNTSAFEGVTLLAFVERGYRVDQ